MRLRTFASVLLVAALICITPAGRTQGVPTPEAAPGIPEAETRTAPVTVDGRALFNVRGITAYPAEKRAAAIESRIIAAAEDEGLSTAQLRTVESERSTDVLAGQQVLTSVFDADAVLEGIDRHTLAGAYLARIREAIDSYRSDRTPEHVRAAALQTVLATVVFIPAFALIVWLRRRLSTFVEGRYKERVRSVGIQSFEIVRAESIWRAVTTSLRALAVIAGIVLCYIYLNFVLSLFAGTRPFGNRLLGYVVDPLATMGRALVREIPDLIFLIVLIIVTRYVLRLIRLFFDAVERGTVAPHNFDKDWASPTYRLVRIGVVAFAAVVAYPYIPGSGSEAFKGISVFLGVMFSIGSSSFISNTIAGYALTYRRAFKVGDRVKINDVVGDVTEMRLQVTQLRSLKNEEVIIPNSLILNNQVVNYSAAVRKGGVILHTTIGIGYETPWRQVEAMLLLAAERTARILQEPKPFVLQKSLGDFCIDYELNAYCDDASAMFRLYTDLHRNILDVFNEHGVQIMTPAYEGDPEQPKVVPKDQWYTAPAATSEPNGRNT